MIGRRFGRGDTVTPETLLKRGLVRRIKGRTPKVKILGQGKLTEELVFKGVLFSKSAAEKLRLP
jgi:large subunit ribosomal protein L15